MEFGAAWRGLVPAQEFQGAQAQWKRGN